MPTQPHRHYTLEEYFALELASEERYEYHDGVAFDLSYDASLAHIRITSNLIFAIHAAVRAKDCHAYSSNLRIKVPAAPPYRYADLTVCCGKPLGEEIGSVDALVNPSLIIEILSPSTEAYDRGDKFTHYKSIESFGEYLLVAQHRPHATHYVKKEDGAWTYEEVNDLAGALKLATLDCQIEMRDVYEDVEFPPVVLPPLERE